MQDQVEATSSGPAVSYDESITGMVSSYKIQSVGVSDIGLVRHNNEDAWGELPAMGLYLLADGMGGHQAGEIASKETVEGIRRVLKRKSIFIKNGSLDEIKELVHKVILHVNKLIYRMGRTKPELRGMGTTLCCLLFHRDGLLLAHVGDSRIYRFRGSKLEQLTKDHSLLCELVELGQLNQQQAIDFLYKNIITRAIGTEPSVEPTIDIKKVHHNDIYLMCSDGLTDPLPCEEIATILKSSESLQEAAERLVREALNKGGRDNITVVLAKVCKT